MSRRYYTYTDDGMLSLYFRMEYRFFSHTRLETRDAPSRFVFIATRYQGQDQVSQWGVSIEKLGLKLWKRVMIQIIANQFHGRLLLYFSFFLIYWLFFLILFYLFILFIMGTSTLSSPGHVAIFCLNWTQKLSSVFNIISKFYVWLEKYIARNIWGVHDWKLYPTSVGSIMGWSFNWPVYREISHEKHHKCWWSYAWPWNGRIEESQRALWIMSMA